DRVPVQEVDAVPQPGGARPQIVGRSAAAAQAIPGELQRLLQAAPRSGRADAGGLSPAAHRRAGGPGLGRVPDEAAKQEMNITPVDGPGPMSGVPRPCRPWGHQARPTWPRHIKNGRDFGPGPSTKPDGTTMGFGFLNVLLLYGLVALAIPPLI